jgi:hypothetical protein
MLLVLGISGCYKDKDGGGNNSKGGIHSFPLTVGNAWKFHTEAHIDSAGVNLLESYYYDFWKVLSDTSINGIPSAKISQLDSNYSGKTYLGYTYYANKQDGFYGMAVVNYGSLLFLKSSGIFSKTHFSILNTFENKLSHTDSVFNPDNPLHLMKFPVVINESWRSYEGGINSNVMRKWLGDTAITTDAGNFACKKLIIFSDNDLDGKPDKDFFTVFQYFSTKGLIMETRTDSVTFPDGGRGILHQTTKLVKVNF